MNSLPYDYDDEWEWADEPTSRLERWLAVKAFAALMLFVLAVAVIIGAFLLARRLVEPRPYTDPSPPPAAVSD